MFPSRLVFPSPPCQGNRTDRQDLCLSTEDLDIPLKHTQKLFERYLVALPRDARRLWVAISVPVVPRGGCVVPNPVGDIPNRDGFEVTTVLGER